MKFLCKIVLVGLLTCWVVTLLAAEKSTKTDKKQAPPAVTTEVSGLESGEALDNVKAVLKELQKDLKPPLRKSELEDYYHDSLRRIPEALEPFGYIKAKVVATREWVNQHWTFRYTITPGRVVKVSKVTIDIEGPGKQDKHFQHIIKHFPVKVGQDLNIPKYNKGKNAFYNTASQYGYFSSRLEESKIIIHVTQYTAEYVFKFETGQRSRFGETTFSRSPLAKSFLRKYLRYKAGEFYDSEKVQKTQEDLSKSNYFQSLSIDPRVLHQNNHRVPMRINLIMRKRRAYTLGLGYGTDTGIRGTLGLDWRWINRRGHHVQVRLRGSQDNNELVGTYFVPGSHPATHYYTYEVAAGRVDYNSGKSKILRLSVGDNRQLNQYWKQVITLNAVRERYNLVDLPQTTANLIYPAIQWSYLNSNDRNSPSRGLSFSSQVAGAPNALSTTSGFWQVKMSARMLWTLKATHTRFLLRTDLGHTTIKSINNLPFSLQLFAGGARSVRGYSFQSIGPGRDMVVGSAEIQQKVMGPVYLAGFYDAGNVADGDEIFKGMNVGVGPGVAVLTPLGQIELTVGWAISQPGDPYKIQFSMGPAL